MSAAIVAGVLANKPTNGGEAWVRLSWALGLRRMGFDVHLVEEIASEHCVDGDGRRVGIEASVNLEFFRRVVMSAGLPATLLCDGVPVIGPSLVELRALSSQAELLVNISGHLRDPELLSRPRCRIYLDVDPGFTQAWHAAGLDVGLAGHDLYATMGERIGEPACPIPTGGLDWIPTRPPVVLSEWPLACAPPTRGLTTVATWRCAQGPVELDGRMHSLKHHEFRRLLMLARRSPLPLELALSVDAADAADVSALRRHEWSVVDAHAVAGDPAAFRQYVAESAGELSAAQGAYVATRCGWLSDRTACYLASGRPAVVQDTGTTLPVGCGLLTFRTPAEAAEAIAEVAGHPGEHARAARRIAEAHLDSDVVIGALLERVAAAGARR